MKEVFVSIFVAAFCILLWIFSFMVIFAILNGHNHNPYAGILGLILSILFVGGLMKMGRKFGGGIERRKLAARVRKEEEEKLAEEKRIAEEADRRRMQLEREQKLREATVRQEKDAISAALGALEKRD